MALKSSVERAPSNLEALAYSQKSGCHRSVRCGNPCCCSQCFFLLEHKGKVASSQQSV